MSVSNTRRDIAYGLTNALQNVSPAPIVAQRAPTTTDYAPIGQTWIDVPANDGFVLTSIVAGSATWINIGGGGGSFSSLTVTPGPISLTGTTTINTTGSATTSIGSTTGASGITLRVGTGNYSLDGVAASTYTVGASTTTGTITIGGTAQTGTITVGSSSGTNILSLGVGAGATTVNIATGATNAKTVNIATANSLANTVTIGGNGANVIAIGNTQTGGSISIGGALTTGTLSMGGGSAATTIVGNPINFNTADIEMATSSSDTTINIGTGAGGNNNTVTIGSVSTTSTLNLQAGTGKINLTGRLKLSGGCEVICGLGDPNTVVTAAQGSLFLRTDGSSTSTRAYINTNGITAWTSITTAT